MPFDAWKKLKQVEFKGAYKKFLTKTYQLPDGSVHEFDIWFTKYGFVQIFALTPKNEVIVAKQFRPGPEKVAYDMPAGLVDKGESLKTAAARELLEETGYSSDKLILLVEDVINQPYNHGAGNYFLAQNCKKTHQPQPDDAESIEVELMPLKKYVNEVLRKGQTSHADAAWLAIDYLIRTKQIKYSDFS